MIPRPHPSAALRWLLAGLLPVTTGAIEYLWLQATWAGPGCEMGPGSPSLPGLGLLAFMAPWAIATYVWSTSGSLRKAWAPMLVTAVLATAVGLFVLVAWSAGHQCFE